MGFFLFFSLIIIHFWVGSRALSGVFMLSLYSGFGRLFFCCLRCSHGFFHRQLAGQGFSPPPINTGDNIQKRFFFFPPVLSLSFFFLLLFHHFRWAEQSVVGDSIVGQNLERFFAIFFSLSLQGTGYIYIYIYIYFFG